MRRFRSPGLAVLLIVALIVFGGSNASHSIASPDQTKPTAAQNAPAGGPPNGPPGLFSDAVGATAADVSPNAIRSRYVTINFQALGLADASGKSLALDTGGKLGRDVALDLFPDAQFVGKRERLETVAATNGLLWTGTLEGVENSTVTLSVIDGSLAGTIFTPGAIYRIRLLPGGGSVHVIEQIDQRTFPPELDRDSAEAPLPPSPISPRTTGDAGADNGSLIDVMILWTQQAQDQAGGLTQIQQVATQAVAAANTAYANSGITFRIRLVYSALESGYTEDADMQVDRDRLANTSDGYMDNVLGLRNQYGADIVTLLVSNQSFCGIAFIDTTLQPSFENSAYNIVSQICAGPNLSYPHEMGHNEAARHDWYVDATDNSPYHYNHGYYPPDHSFRTVMAYANGCGSCTRVPYFSSPSVTYTAQLTGTSAEPQPANNALVLNNVANLTANFRTTVVPVVPTVTSVSPTHGPGGGGTVITIQGTGFSTTAGATSVTVGGRAATGVSCSSTTTCTATTPQGYGTVDVRVTVGGQTSAIVTADQFTYDYQPWTVTLSASSASTYENASVTLTATANQNVGPTPYYIRIYDTTSSNTLLYSCGNGTTCQGTVTGVNQTHSFRAYVSDSAGGNVQATSTIVSVTWGPAFTVSLAASTTTPAANQSVTLTATSNQDVGQTPYFIEIADTTGTATRLSTCGSGTTCQATVTGAGQTKSFSATIAANDGSSVQATSSTVSVAWAAACQNGVKADITSPTGTSITTGTPTFQWGGGVCVTQYYLYVGSSASQADLYNSGPLAGNVTQATVSPAIPLDGRTIYVRLWSQVNGTFQAVDHTYTMSACQNGTKADITSPTGGTISSGTPTFQWGGGVCVTQYYLYIGNTFGQADLYNSGPLAGNISQATVSPAIPVDGRTIYVRLWSLVNGSFQAVDHSYIMGACQNGTKADITSPTGGSITTGTPTFQWGGGVCVTQYYLYVGSSASQADLYNSGPLAGNISQATVSPAIPVDGRTIYVRLWSLVNGSFQAVDHSYIMGACQNGTKADITSPTGGSITTGTPTFQWGGGVCVTQYYLYVGSSASQADLYNSGPLAGNISQATVSPAIPLDGRTIYVRLWSLVNGGFQAVDHSYIMGACQNPSKADISSPLSSTLHGTSQVFQWSGGACVTQYYLYVGSSAGQTNLYNSGPLAGTVTSQTVTTLPANSSTVYLRLWSLVNGTWQAVDHNYVSAP